MQLGVFSISLAVKDLAASRAFYVRELQRRLKAQGVPLVADADEGTSGPAYCMAVDPDGNPVLVDQHVPKEG
jgi:hypothetical protein